MKMRLFLGTIAILLLLTSSTLALEPNKKMGYGFAPGLVPGKDFVAGQLIVGMKEGLGTQDLKQAVSASGVRISKEIQGALLLQFASEEAARAAVSSLASRPDVAFVERNGFMAIPAEPKLDNANCGGCSRVAKSDVSPEYVYGDWGTYLQWHHTVIRKTANLGTLSTTPPTVAVVDTGVDYYHPDLYYGKVILGKNCVGNDMNPMDDNGHGTHAAGLIAAYQGYQYGEGVCHNCKVLAIKVLDRNGKGSFFDIADGMQYAIDQATATDPDTRIVYMGLIGPNSSLIADKVLAIKTAKMALVAPAGNDNTTATTNAFPGADPNTALRVMATESTDCRAWFSNFSPSTAATQYNIAAPGWKIYSDLPENGFGPKSSTSAAAAIVAGGAALVWGQNPIATVSWMVSRLIGASARPIKCGFPVTARRLDVRKAILLDFETALIGQIVDPFTGMAPGAGVYGGGGYYPYIRLYSGATQVTGTYTDNTSYQMVGLAANTNLTITGERSGGGYITTPLRTPINITAGATNGPYLDAFPRALADGNATVLFDWKNIQPVVSTTGCAGTCLGWEFDLYVKTPSKAYIGRGNPGGLLTTPYARWPRDSAEDLLPMETIVIAAAAPDGVYKVFVDKAPYASPAQWNPSWVGSLASFQAYNGATAGLTTHYANKSCGTKRYWYVGDLNKTGTAYTWTERNLCTNVKP